MANPDLAVRVDGLQDLRKSLRAVDKGALKEVQAVTKAAAELVAVEARSLAPRRSGKLASSIRATTSGARGIVRSPLPYAAVHHWGGTISPRGTPITIKRTEYITKAAERKQAMVLEALARGFDGLVRRNGWR